MKSLIKNLLLNKLFQSELSQFAKGPKKQHVFRRIKSGLQIDQDGNIDNVNGIVLGGEVYSQLSYLIGSINFLFTQLDDEIRDNISEDTKKALQIDLKQKAVHLIVDLLSDLSLASSVEDINEVVTKISVKKLILRKKVVK